MSVKCCMTDLLIEMLFLLFFFSRKKKRKCANGLRCKRVNSGFTWDSQVVILFYVALYVCLDVFTSGPSLTALFCGISSINVGLSFPSFTRDYFLQRNSTLSLLHNHWPLCVTILTIKTLIALFFFRKTPYYNSQTTQISFLSYFQIQLFGNFFQIT